MEYKLIHTENYLLVIDDSEIKEGDYITDKYKVWKWNDDLKLDVPLLLEQIVPPSLLGCKKIIAHLPLNNSPILEGVDLLPPLEDELDKIYNEVDYAYSDWKYFEKGYNKAKETYKYTEEDIKAAYIKGGNDGALYNALQDAEDWDALEEIDENEDKNLEEFIQSLQQPKLPIVFECEMELIGFQDLGDLEVEVPKSFSNSLNQTVWVGKYVF